MNMTGWMVKTIAVTIVTGILAWSTGDTVSAGSYQSNQHACKKYKQRYDQTGDRKWLACYHRCLRRPSGGR